MAPVRQKRACIYISEDNAAFLVYLRLVVVVDVELLEEYLVFISSKGSLAGGQSHAPRFDKREKCLAYSQLLLGLRAIHAT
jgi:hypothetical protein